jgi:hypothetical protein
VFEVGDFLLLFYSSASPALALLSITIAEGARVGKSLPLMLIEKAYLSTSYHFFLLFWAAFKMPTKKRPFCFSLIFQTGKFSHDYLKFIRHATAKRNRTHFTYFSGHDKALGLYPNFGIAQLGHKHKPEQPCFWLFQYGLRKSDYRVLCSLVPSGKPPQLEDTYTQNNE